MEISARCRKPGCMRISSCFPGIWKALHLRGAGIAVAIPAHAGYNYLVSRSTKSSDWTQPPAKIVTRHRNGNGNPDEFPRNTVAAQSIRRCAVRRVFLPAVIFLMAPRFWPTRGFRCNCQSPAICPARTNRTYPSRVTLTDGFYFANQMQ